MRLAEQKNAAQHVVIFALKLNDCLGESRRLKASVRRWNEHMMITAMKKELLLVWRDIKDRTSLSIQISRRR